MRCIFCYRDSLKCELTEEHVFPQALGGELVVRCVCKGCNDQLGSYVDSLIAEDFLVRMLRLGLRIPNKSGVIPSPLHDGDIKDYPNRKGSYLLSTPGDVGQVRLRPLVERTTGPDGQPLVKIVAEPHEADEILSKLRERAARRGQNIRVLESWQETFRKPSVVKEAQTQPTNLLRPIFKITYELGVLWLGAEYATHVGGIPLARAVVAGAIADVAADVGYFPPQSAFADWTIPTWYHAARLETVNGQVWTALRVFNVIEARVLLAEAASDFSGVSARWVLLDPLTGRVEHGGGAPPPPITAEEGKGIVWDQVDANRYRVSVVNQGHVTTTTEMELSVASSA